MRQIKTIYNMIAEDFDNEVNAALAEGWELTKRTMSRAGGYIAEMEREIIGEDEKTCENCKHRRLLASAEPCVSCDPQNGVCYWEAT